MDLYQSTLDYLLHSLPMYQRQGKAAYKPGIGNISELCNLLNKPQEKFKSIHIAGTNGKGSTAHMLSSILQTKGLKVGLYTSPHLVDFRERVKINGEIIDKQYVIDFVSKNKVNFEAINTSFFEWTVALAFDYFAQKEVDIAIIETGLGGRLDSTNIINPLLSIITNIGFDHVQFLGNTLDKIAFEKAGIIKPNTPVVIGEFNPITKPVFDQKSREENAPIYLAYKQNTTYESDLLGHYQKTNINTVVCAIQVLNEVQNQIQISKENIKDGLLNVKSNTGLKGRFDLINKKPLTYCDCAHNEDGLKLIFKQIKSIKHKKLHLVYGTVNDKDVKGITTIIPKEAKLYLCAANIPRSMPVNELKLYFKNRVYETFNGVKEAYKAAIECAQEEDLILIIGSTFIVSDLYLYLENEL